MGRMGASARESAAAQQLTSARTTRSRISDLGENAPQDVSEAHHIADQHAALLGLPAVGWKVGCTSSEAMQLLNSPGPFAGRVFEGSVATSGAVAFGDLVAPSAECEFAFLLAADLPGRKEQYSIADVRAATAAVAPAIELVDPRFENMREVGYLSLIADSGVNGAAVIGTPVPVDDVPDLADVTVRCEVDGDEVGVGTGSDILGDPWFALEWIANHLAARGLSLSAGQFVLSGTCTGIAPVAIGESVRADFGDFGEVSFTCDTTS